MKHQHGTRSDGVAGDADPGDPDCIFCEIVAGRAEADVAYRDDVVVAFLDRSPLFEGHVLVVPRQHVVTLTDLPVEVVGPFALRVRMLARAVPVAMEAQGSFVANNNIVSQSVAHLHVHVVPRVRGDGLRGFFWPRTRYEPGRAEEVAATIGGVIDSFDLGEMLASQG